MDAHRLIWPADQYGCQDAVVEALFRAYFSDAQDIGSRQTLIDVATEGGIGIRKSEFIIYRLMVARL